MIHAYDDQYLDDAMICLGEAMDYVANICQIEMDRFLELFIGTGYAEQFGAGVPKYVSGFQEGREKFKRAFSLLPSF